MRPMSTFSVRHSTIAKENLVQISKIASSFVTMAGFETLGMRIGCSFKHVHTHLFFLNRSFSALCSKAALPSWTTTYTRETTMKTKPGSLVPLCLLYMETTAPHLPCPFPWLFTLFSPVAVETDGPLTLLNSHCNTVIVVHDGF